MPKVGDKEFPYTPEGIQEAAKESSESGIPVQDAGSRGESYQLGGQIPGTPGFGQKPLPNPPLPSPGRLPGTASSVGMYKKGGKVDKYAKGGNIGGNQPMGTILDRLPWESHDEVLWEKGGKVGRKARREERQEKRNVRKINRLARKKGQDKVKLGKNYDASKGKPTGKIKAGVKEVTLTGGGAYATYGKKSVPAKSFRKAFSSASQAGKKTFTWHGRSYTTKKK